MGVGGNTTAGEAVEVKAKPTREKYYQLYKYQLNKSLLKPFFSTQRQN